jgi:uncharacterized membrane protein
MLGGLIQNLRPLLHPMVVHFPIALLCASVVLDGAGFGLRRPGVTRAGFFTLVLGTVGAGVAAITGPDHTSGGPVVQALLTSHQSFALMTVALAVALMVVRFTAPRGIAGGWALGYLACALLLLVTLSLTGYFGGELTYHQGVGVAAVSATVPQAAGTPDSGGTGVSVKPLVALLGLFSAGVIGTWLVAGRTATGGFFADWWQALRHESDEGGALWTLRWQRQRTSRDAAAPFPRDPLTDVPHGESAARR